MANNNLLNFSLEELSGLISPEKTESYRVKQIFRWLHQKLASDFSQMSDVGKTLRENLQHRFVISYPTIQKIQTSKDGTRKFLFRLHDGHSIEAVYIPEVKRSTVCLSSQVGCALGCTFCLTAQMGFLRNLEPYEIITQFYGIKKELKLDRISNIVFMGMGEPLLNHKNVIRAITILTSDFGQGVASRRITVSTAGVVKNIEPLLSETKVSLALSLNATEDSLRDKIMPINKKYPLKTLIETLETLPMPKRRRVTIEYVLIKNVNDTLDDAKRLVRLLSRVRAKVNLIPYNENPYISMNAPELKRIDEFHSYLIGKNITTMIRKQRGLDILSACGQLRVVEQDQKHKVFL